MKNLNDSNTTNSQVVNHSSENDEQKNEKIALSYAENSTLVHGESVDRDSLKITIPRHLLEEADAFCETFNITRSNFISGCVGQTLYPNFQWSYNVSLWKQKLYYFRMRDNDASTILEGFKSGLIRCTLVFSQTNSPSQARPRTVFIDRYDEEYVYISVPDSLVWDKKPWMLGAEMPDLSTLQYLDPIQIDRGGHQLIVPAFFDSYNLTPNIFYKIPLDYIWQVL